ncbi:MAG: hypothetical protein G5663_02440 [Serratia symbiotica]|nr:hypothetical protein [Serratia symbiotica]
MLDANQQAEKSEFYTMGRLDVSLDNRMLRVVEDFLLRKHAKTLLPYQVYRHAVGTHTQKD